MRYVCNFMSCFGGNDRFCGKKSLTVVTAKPVVSCIGGELNFVELKPASYGESS